MPLRDGTHARGRLARVSKSGVLLGYFFGPSFDRVPTENDYSDLFPQDALLVGRFGDLGLTKGKWPIFGHDGGWARADWKCTEFGRFEELTGRYFVAQYSDDDPGVLIGEKEVNPGAIEGLPKDGMMGAGFVEAKLTLLLQNDRA